MMERLVNFFYCLIPITVVIGFFEIFDGFRCQTGKFGQVFSGHVEFITNVVDLLGESGLNVSALSEVRLDFGIIF